MIGVELDQQSGLQIVADTTAAIAAAPDLDQALRMLIAGMQRLTNAESGGVRLLNEPGRASAGCRLFFWRGGDRYEWQELPGESGSNVDTVVATGVPQYTADLALLAARGDALAAAAHGRDGLGSSLIVPLRSQGQVIGTLHADSYHSGAFSPGLLLPLQVLADHAGGAVARATSDVRRQGIAEQVVATLARVGAAAGIEEALEALLRGAIGLLHGAGGVARAFDVQTRESIFLLAIRPDGTITQTRQAQPINEGSMAAALMDGGPSVLIEDYQALDPLGYPLYAEMQRQGIRSSVNVPIHADGQRIGSLHVNHQRPHYFGRPELNIAEALAAQAGAAIERAGLAETERSQLQERLANEARFRSLTDKFIALVSHELRTPLTSIKGYADLLLAGEVGDLSLDQREFLTVIKRNADREVTLVNELLDLSRLEAGQVELTPLPLDLKPLLQEVAASLQSQMQARRQQFRLVLPSQLPPVLGDSTRLVQIFTNLVANANKYTPEGGRITVTAQVVAGAIAVDVDDTGIGLTEEDQSRLFTKFFRAKNQLTQESGGTGLGLAITRALVERHGGTITVTSTPGVGSTFTVTLPAAPPEWSPAV
jgi:signal transduction histidine kinase